jgi:NADH:ubiquinone oxidoreductase subunit 4 (subunit M)
LRGGPVFFAFFVFFLVASLAVPGVPLFPGNMVPTWLNLSMSADGYLVFLLSGLVNGFMYGLLIWAVYFLATRNMDDAWVSDYKARRRNHRNSKKKSDKR